MLCVYIRQMPQHGYIAKEVINSGVGAMWWRKKGKCALSWMCYTPKVK